MRSLTGTTSLMRLAFRRDRITMPVWLLVFAGMAGSSASATVGLYPTAPERVAAAQTFNGSQSLVALYGKVYDPHSIGALAMVKLGGIGAVFVAVLAILVTVRHTRAEEESGRLEMIGATVVGRRAPLTAALAVGLLMNITLALVTALWLAAAGLPASGSFAFGFAWAGVGIAFAAVAALTAQVASSARVASGLALGVLGLVYLLRAVGDTADRTGPRWLTWLSPIGWSQQFRPYAGNRWWVLLITLGFAVVVACGAYLLVARRDLGAGLVPEHAGRRVASARLRGSLALAWRLQRGTLVAWLVSFAVGGLVLGNIASSVSGFVSSQQARDVFTRLGGQQALTNAYLAAVMSIMGVVAAAYGIQAAMRLRSEESTTHAESVLATGTTRSAWALSHTSVALLGTTALMLVAGLGAGAAYAGHTGHVLDMGRVLGGALVQIPAAWVLAAIVLAAFGVSSRLAAAGWVALVAFVVLGEIGPLLRLDQRVMDVSPFAHVPRLPGVAVHATPIVALTAVAGALLVIGLVGFRRRDVG